MVGLGQAAGWDGERGKFPECSHVPRPQALCMCSFPPLTFLLPDAPSRLSPVVTALGKPSLIALYQGDSC